MHFCMHNNKLCNNVIGKKLKSVSVEVKWYDNKINAIKYKASPFALRS